MKNAKAKSSKWINESGLHRNDFAWQAGYGVFSYNHNDVKNIYQYILNQEEHHQKQTFREEYKALLEQFKIDFDERYVFQELI